MSYRSPANRLASSPPSAPRISMMTARPSLGSSAASAAAAPRSSASRSASASASSVAQRLALVVGGHREQLAGRLGVGGAGPVAAHAVDHRREVLVATGDLAQPRLVVADLGVGKARLQRDELVLHGLQSIEHRRSRLRSQSTGTMVIGRTHGRGQQVLHVDAHRGWASPARTRSSPSDARASTAYGTASRSTPVRAHHRRGHPVDDGDRHARHRVLQVRARHGRRGELDVRGADERRVGRPAASAAAAPGRAATADDRLAPCTRCWRTTSTTSASAGAVGRSPCSVRNASRSCAPTPTSRRVAPVYGSSTTRQTSSPATSPKSTPNSSCGVGARVDDDVDELAVRAPAPRAARAAARARRAAAPGPRRATPRSGSANPSARRASSPVADSATTCSAVAPLAQRPRQREPPRPRSGRSASSTHASPSSTQRRRRAANSPGSEVGFAADVVAHQRGELDGVQSGQAGRVVHRPATLRPRSPSATT